MENLEGLVYETTRKINARANVHNAEQEELLLQDMNRMTRELVGDLQNYGMSSRVLGNVEDKFYELKVLLTKMNRGQAERITENSLSLIKSKISMLEEKEEQGKIDFQLEEQREENKQPKDYMYIEDCVRGIFNDIQRNIGTYIETERCLGDWFECKKN